MIYCNLCKGCVKVLKLHKFDNSFGQQPNLLNSLIKKYKRKNILIKPNTIKINKTYFKLTINFNIFN